MSIDPRLIERRRTVAEDNAKQNVSRLLKFMALLLLLGAGVWLVFSPWLSVSQVDTSGIAVSRAHSILADRGVVAGTPMIRVGTAGAEQALLEDPWIASAEVSLDWPNRVIVEIVERSPVAWTQTGDGWTRRAADGVALPSDPEPDAAMAWIEMPQLSDDEATGDPDLRGALEFADALPARLHAGTVVYRHDGELWATVSGHQVRLGRGVDMAAKALSLQALLEEDLPDDATLVLIAPTNPAVMVPSAPGEEGEAVEEEVDGEVSESEEGDGAGSEAESAGSTGDEGGEGG